MTISAAFRTIVTPTGGATTAPIAEFQPGVTDYVMLRRLYFQAQSLNANDFISLAIGIPAAAGVGLSGEIALVQSDAGDSQSIASMKIFAHWTTPPTAPTAFFRRVATEVVTASFSLITFDFVAGLRIAPAGSLVLWLALASTGVTMICDVTAEFEG